MSGANARTVLHKLVDLAEDRPPEARERRIQRRLDQRFDGPDAQAAHDRLLEQAQAAGGIELERGRRELAHLYAKVYLADLDALYRFLGRKPAGELAARAAGEIDTLADRLAYARADAEALADAWRSGRSYAGLGRDDMEEAKAFLNALDAVLAGDFAGRDMRTISVRRLGDSKLLERQMSRIARALRTRGLADEAADDREALAALGLEKFPPEVRLAGPASVAGADLSGLVFVALPPEHAPAVKVPAGTPLVTVENLTSFNRYVREARTPHEVVVYTGGFPSRAVSDLLVALADQVGSCHHWGDVDAAGLRIAVDVGRHLHRLPRLWRMTPELAIAHGRSVGPVTVGGLPDDAPQEYVALAEFLAGADARVLEQEDLDPTSPTWFASD